MIKRFLEDERAQAITEIVLAIALIAVVIIAALKLFKRELSDLIKKVVVEP